MTAREEYDAARQAYARRRRWDAVMRLGFVACGVVVVGATFAAVTGHYGIAALHLPAYVVAVGCTWYARTRACDAADEETRHQVAAFRASGL